MTKSPNRFQIFVKEAWHQLDASILVVAALSFTIAGFLGLPERFLSPVIVALLGLLAVSQFRSRSQVESVAATWHRARTNLLSSKFPGEYITAQTTVSHSYFYTGATMKRTMAMMGDHIPRILGNNGLVRILLPDPRNMQLMEMIAATRPGKSVDAIRNDLETSLRDAVQLRSDKGNLQIRTIQFVPSIGINAMDLQLPTKSIMVQMYEFAAVSGTERAPIFFLEAGDHEWFSHFEAQLERLWDQGKEYTEPTGQ